jgi:periplasmic protein TonB
VEVTDVLRERMQEPTGLRLTALVSLLVHSMLAAALVYGPIRWLSQPATEDKPVMTITLGGAGTGPKSGGLTAISARPVQTTEPPPLKAEPIRAPAAKIPEMTTPKIVAKAASPPKPVDPPVDSAPPDARGKTPTRGEEVRPGSAIAETGVRGEGFGGLSTGGGPGSGSTLDVADFCCPDYLILMTDRIRSNWSQQVEVSGSTVVKFTIQRDGTLTDISSERTSGYASLDLNARRAIQVTRQLPPLPQAFPNQTLTVHLNFQYQR